MSANTPQPTGRIVAGRYRLGERIGSSAEFVTFDAFDEQAQRMVMVKVINPDLGDAPQVRRQFRSTMAIAAGINHPNVAPIHDFGTDRWGQREVLYVVSERYDGGSLRDLLDRGRLLAPSQALVVGLEACKALDAVHRAGLVHSDIRPSTLVFGDDRKLRLVDVGLSEVLRGVAGDPAARPVDRVRYASPEEAQGRPPEAKSDVYALCLTLLETLSGSVPFESDSAVSTLANRVDKLMPVSADLGPLAAVLERAGRPATIDRYTAAEFGRALVGAAEKLPRPAPIPIVGAVAAAAEPAPTLAIDEPQLSPFAPTTAAPISIVTSPVLRDDASMTHVLPELPPDDEYYDEVPRKSKRWLVIVLALLAIGGAAAAYFVLKPEMITVPNLAGVEEGVALNQVAGQFDTIVEREPSDEIAEGLVIRTDPEAGSQLEKGKTLTIVVSTGPPPALLPELNGLTLEGARQALESIGLVVEETEPEFSDDFPEGQIMKWEVADTPTLKAGDTVTRGTVVKITVSKGPAPRAVPDLTGKTFDEATAVLQAMGLVILKGDDVFSPDVPIGMVAAFTPPKDTEVTIGDTITVNLSKGPDLVVLPAATGLDYNGIIAALQAAGFTIGPVSGNPSLQFVSYSVNGVVATPGQQFPRGTAVALTFKTK